MTDISIMPCACDAIDELNGLTYKLSIDPTARPKGTPLFAGDEMLVRGFLIQVQLAQTVNAYLGWKDASETGACFEIAPGQNHFRGVSESMENVVAIPRPRIRPYNWLVNSTAAMSVSVTLFL